MNSLDQFLLFVALPFVVIASLVEALVLSRRMAYDWRATGVSMLDLAARVAIQLFLPLSIAAPFIVLAYRHRLGTISLNGWQALLALFVGQEFCYYWYHRAAHRVHHAANLEYLDANYGGVLIVFDRLFGTYRAERDDIPCRYGLVEPVVGHNVLRIEFGQWVRLWRDLIRARGLREWLGTLFMPPGWKASGDGQTTEDLRRAASGVHTHTAILPTQPEYR